MNDLRRRDFGDPLAILIAREAETCAGCQWLEVQRYMGITKYGCRQGRQKASTDFGEMQRCRGYVEKFEANIQSVDKE